MQRLPFRSLVSSLSFPAIMSSRFYIILFIAIILSVSYSLFFYLQYNIENDTKTRLIKEQINSQLESTKKLSRHIGSDLDSIVVALHGLANSAYLQQGDLSSDRVDKLMREVYSQVNMFTIVDRLLIIDRNNSATLFVVPEEQTEPHFGSDNISLEQLVNQTKTTRMPTFTNGFRGLDGKYRVAITFPILNRQTNEYMGTLAALIPTLQFFEYYGNVHDIKSQYLVALDRSATFMTHPLKQYIGINFFDNAFQEFIEHNKDYNIQIHQVLSLPASFFSSFLAYDGQQQILQQQQQLQQQEEQPKEEQEQKLLQPSYKIYDYGIGERLSSGLLIVAQKKPVYSIFLVTPTSDIYSQVDNILLLERIGMFSLLVGATLAIVLLAVFLLRWNRTLNTEVKRRTKELEETNEKLIVRDKMQEEFINIAAHELRTPLQPIISYSKLALKDKIDKVEAMKGIDRNAGRLHKLATDLLAVSRIEGGRLSYKTEKVRINDLILDIANNCVNTAAMTHGAESARMNVSWSRSNDHDMNNYYNNHDNNIRNLDTTVVTKKEEIDENNIRNITRPQNDGISNSGAGTGGEKDAERQEQGQAERQGKEVCKEEKMTEEEEDRTRTDKLNQQQQLQLQQEQLQEEEERKLTIDVNLDPDIKEIDVDRDGISQVLSNLIDNSLKFTSTRGCCIKIQTDLIKSSLTSATQKYENSVSNKGDNAENANYNNDDDKSKRNDNDDDKIKIEISDTGGGIPNEILPSLFQKFVTRGVKGRENKQGTGLGLFITKSIITAHSGDIEAYNNDIGGATFSIILPIRAR
jgi:signal transduction histidine kinase